jgi:outer membrane lipoprotein SlyB
VQYRQPVPYSNNSRYRDDSYRDSNYRTDTYRDDRRVYNGRRSTEKSAVIIGGTAAAGAVLGGIAGGGKGAAIGALSGGAIGAIYDRLTHKKTDGYGWRNNRY